MAKSRKNVSRRKNRKSLKKQKTNRRRMSGGAWWTFGNDKLTEDEKNFLLNVEWKAPNNYPSKQLSTNKETINKEIINQIINERTNGDIKTIQDLQNVAQLPEKYYTLYMRLNAELNDLGGA